jgi:hypothetical protein
MQEWASKSVGWSLANPWYVYGVTLHLALVDLRVKKYIGMKFVL